MITLSTMMIRMAMVEVKIIWLGLGGVAELVGVKISNKFDLKFDMHYNFI